MKANRFFITNKIFFLCTAIALLTLLPFVILSFFSHAGADDYLMQGIYEQSGFWQTQKNLYANWNGRFFANFLQILGIKYKLVTSYYFVFSLVLFLLTYFAAFYLVKTLNRFILGNSLSSGQIIQTGFIGLMLNIYLLANTGENFYWYSAALIYQMPVIILLLLFSLLVKRFTATGRKNVRQDVMICLLLALIAGCNETIAVTMIVLLTVTLLFLYKINSRHLKIAGIYGLVMLAACSIIYLTSGIQNRQKFMNTETGYLSIFAITGFRAFSVFYYLFREPLFWVAALGCFLQGIRTVTFPVYLNLKKIAICFLLAPLIVAGTLLPLMVLSKGAFPDRALNNIIVTAACLVLLLCFLAGQWFTTYQRNERIFSILSSVMPIFFSIALVCSACQVNAWKSVCSGYFYARVLHERDRLFANARQHEQTAIQINTYPEDAAQQVQQVFPHGTFQSLHNICVQKPYSIPFFNEAEEQGAASLYAVYYGIDQITIRPGKP
ncbi:MAG: hypothetical protein KF862_17495 [Chitinophagaceae bacterium]|nr:hypothetical protein [Chitinophagaceae bacterium]